MSHLTLEHYKALIRVRLAELQLAERYKKQEMRTPTHFGVGQEATAVGVCAALTDEDVAYSHHRSHNHFLAKGGSVYALAAELFGRADGCSRGRGGSVHLTDRSCGFIASSAILGEAMAAATGSALALKMDGAPHLSVAFFGDAVAEEGAFYECLSYAALHTLPVLFVCENNGYATESPLDIRQPKGAGISARVASFGITTHEADGNDLVAVLETAEQAVKAIRAGKGPIFLELETYRWLEHVGPHFDHVLGRDYRDEAELKAWQDKDPVTRYRDQLMAAGIADAAALDAAWADMEAAVAADIERAYDAPWPDTAELFDNVY